MAKKLAVLMTVVCIGLAAFVVNIKLAEDDKGPDITFSQENLVYNEHMSDADLLADVSAIDSRDGDVSDSLTIEDIYSVSDENVVVVYVAKDTSNNITKIKRFLEADNAEEVSGSDETETLDVEEANSLVSNENGIISNEIIGLDEGNSDTEEITSPVEETVTEGVPVEEKSLADQAREEQEALADNMAAGCPKLYLTDYYIEVPIGTTISAMSYVKDIVDESENFYELSKRVQIYDSNGNQPGVNISFPTAGTYEYKFFVVDNQSNTSNSAKLIVEVK